MRAVRQGVGAGEAEAPMPGRGVIALLAVGGGNGRLSTSASNAERRGCSAEWGGGKSARSPRVGC